MEAIAIFIFVCVCAHFATIVFVIKTLNKHKRDFMIKSWVAEQLSRFTYKPGWKFTVEPGLFSTTHRLDSYSYLGKIAIIHRLRIEAEVEDSRNLGAKIKIVSNIPIPNFQDPPDEKAFSDWLKDVIKRVENHEFDEWFKRDGILVDDPHRREYR